jgi:hypothetical protein
VTFQESQKIKIHIQVCKGLLPSRIRVGEDFVYSSPAVMVELILGSAIQVPVLVLAGRDR